MATTTSSTPSLHVAGLEVPRLGLGTFGMDSDTAQRMVEAALAVGYRHIDTAQRYENEEGVGAAVRSSGVARHEVFVATKIPHTDASRDSAPDSVRRSIEALGLDYVDLLYLHWPHSEIGPEETYASLLPLVQEGVVRGLGTSNFTSALVRRAMSVAPLVANQVEHHPYLPQRVLESLAVETGTCLTTYAPFAQGRIFQDPVLISIAEKHGATAGQVVLRWLLDKPRTVVIPKTQTESRLEPNLRCLGVVLDDEDRARIEALGADQKRYFDPPWAPSWDE